MLNDSNYMMDEVNDMYGTAPYSAPMPGMNAGMPMMQPPYMNPQYMYGMDYDDMAHMNGYHMHGFENMGNHMMPQTEQGQQMPNSSYDAENVHMNENENQKMCPYVPGMMCPHYEDEEGKEKKKRTRKDTEQS